MLGIDGLGSKTVTTGELEKIQVENIGYGPMKTIIADMSLINNTGWLDGFLGIEFLEQYKTAINYKSKELYIWDPAKERPDIIALAKGTSSFQLETETNPKERE